jgi:hypothetical protein
MSSAQRDVRAHDAVRAWLALHPRQTPPDRITILKPEHQKSAVYRLEGGGLAADAVVAKRCRRATALVERTVYEEILPYVPHPTLRYYGTWDDPQSNLSWLFVEDAGETRYSPADPRHRILAARWLALLHTSAERLVTSVALPDRGLEHYSGLVRAASSVLADSLANPAFDSGHLRALERMLLCCDLLLARWSELQRLWSEMPVTFVHGGFYGKNVRVRNRDGQPVLFAFDWESSGWGVPAIDLAHEDLAVYWAAAGGHWPYQTLQNVETLARIGKLLWALKAIPEEAPVLASPWVDGVMGKMVYYRDQCRAAVRALGWGD